MPAFSVCSLRAPPGTNPVLSKRSGQAVQVRSPRSSRLMHTSPCATCPRRHQCTVHAQAPANDSAAAAAAPPPPVITEAPPAPASAASAGPSTPTPSSAPSLEDTLEVQTQPAGDGKQFSWARNWYPLTSLDYLDPTRPTPLTVLGYNLVVWRDADGEWRCFRDACPHRAAPLSEGRIDPQTKNLECAYHGWHFAGTGAAQEIPQSKPGAPKATACASARSCAVAYPTATAHGLLWVWLEPGVEGRGAAATVPLPVLPATDHRGVEWFEVSSWYIRDLEVDYLPLMENSADPGHVHFTHAGFIGSRDRAGPIQVRLLEQDERGEYRFIVEDPKAATFRHLTIKPPCMLWAASEDMDPAGELALLYFVVPVAPGRCRMMSLVLATNTKFRLLSKVFHWQPWLRHLYNHTVSAQDVAILHRQGTNMAAPDWPGWRKGFYLPTTSDSGIVVLRKWLEGVAGGGVAWGPNVPPSQAQPIQAEGRREVLMDTYHQHTENCPHCQKALRGVRLTSSALVGAAGAFFLGLAYAWGRGIAPLAPASLALLTGLALALTARGALQKLEQKFYFTDWRHADH